MEQKYPSFVAFATLQSFVQLQELLAKWRVEPTPDIVTDAARYGFRKAMESMFPGLPKHPFAIDPQADIEQGLHLYYTHNASPAVVAPGATGGDPSTRRQKPAVVPKALYVQPAADESSSHRMARPSGVFRVPAGSRVSDTSVRRAEDVNLSPPDTPTPQTPEDPRRAAAMSAMANKLYPRRADEESSRQPREIPDPGAATIREPAAQAAAATEQRVSATRLRPIERQPAPWQRKENDSIDEV